MVLAAHQRATTAQPLVLVVLLRQMGRKPRGRPPPRRHRHLPLLQLQLLLVLLRRGGRDHDRHSIVVQRFAIGGRQASGPVPRQLRSRRIGVDSGVGAIAARAGLHICCRRRQHHRLLPGLCFPRSLLAVADQGGRTLLLRRSGTRVGLPPAAAVERLRARYPPARTEVVVRPGHEFSAAAAVVVVLVVAVLLLAELELLGLFAYSNIQAYELLQ